MPSKVLTMFGSCIQDNMDGLPVYAIPIVVTFLDIKQIHRCACINKEWEMCMQQRVRDIREEAIQKRAQVCGVAILLSLYFNFYAGINRFVSRITIIKSYKRRVNDFVHD